MPALTPSARIRTTATTIAAVAVGLLAGACGRGDDPTVTAADAAAVTTTSLVDDGSDLPPIPVPIDPATIPPGPRLVGMDPAQLAKLGFVLTEPRGEPKIGRDLAAVLGQDHAAGEGTVADVVLARVENGHGVGSCELCWVVSVKLSSPVVGSGPGPGPDGVRVTTIPGPPRDPGYAFVLIDAMTGGFITGWG